MKAQNIIEGLQILLKYSAEHGYIVSADHDVIYVDSTRAQIQPADLQRLVDLDWFQEDAKYDKGEGFKVENYDPEQGWTAYT